MNIALPTLEGWPNLFTLDSSWYQPGVSDGAPLVKSLRYLQFSRSSSGPAGQPQVIYFFLEDNSQA